MPSKVGRIATLGKTGRKFQELHLDSGDRVEVPTELMYHLVETYKSNEILLFVERRGRLLNYVQWAGDRNATRLALQRGLLRPDEVPEGFSLPAHGADATGSRQRSGPARPDISSDARAIARGLLAAAVPLSTVSGQSPSAINYYLKTLAQSMTTTRSLVVMEVAKVALGESEGLAKETPMSVEGLFEAATLAGRVIGEFEIADRHRLLTLASRLLLGIQRVRRSEDRVDVSEYAAAFIACCAPIQPN